MRTWPLRMRRITWPVSRGSKTITFLESPTPICLFTTVALRRKWLKLSAKIMHGPVLKDAWVSAHARTHVMCWRCPKCLIAVVLVDVDLPYWTSNVEHIVSFTTIFSNTCTAHAQKRLFMNFRREFRHRHSIRRHRFHNRVQNFHNVATFSVEFCILYAESPPYSIFGLFDLLT